MAIKKMQLHFNKAYEIAPNVMHLHFYPQYSSSKDINKGIDKGPFEFIPGQFITLLFDHEDGVKRRSYSISTIPKNQDSQQDIQQDSEQNGIGIAISYLKDGIASEALFNIKPNTIINAIGPAGKLILKEKEDIENNYNRYILVGTGTGIAPYRSMLPQIKSILNKNKNFSIDLIFGARTREDLFYIQDFLNLSESEPRFKVHAQLSRMDKDNILNSYENHGYAQTAFDRLEVDPEKDIIYLCGNPKMIDDSFEILTDKGFESTQIRREKYISSN